MKKAILVIFFLNCGIGISQSDFPFYEQIAFDFYQSIIIDSFPTKKKVKVYPYAFDFQPDYFAFSNPSCLGITWENNEQFEPLELYVESQIKIDSERFELDFSDIDKKIFKIKKRGKGNYPRLYITAPHTEKNGTEQVFVNIHETHKYLWVTYHFEFNDKGGIIDWCRKYAKVTRTH